MSLRPRDKRKACLCANTGFHMGGFFAEEKEGALSTLKYTTTENILVTLQLIQESYKLNEKIKEFGQVEMDQFGYGKRNSLGSGGYGTVYPVSWPEQKRYAVKVMTIKSEEEKKYLERFSKNLMTLQYGPTAAHFFNPGQRWHFVREPKKDDQATFRTYVREPKKVDQATFRTCDLIIAELSSLQRETGYWNLHHIDHMQKYKDMLETDDVLMHVNIFTKLCWGDVYTLMFSEKDIFATAEWNTLVKDLGAAMHYIHSKGMAHLDIKPNNVLYNKEADGKNFFMLTDYDLMRSTAERGEYTTSVTGTPGFVPPSMEHNYWVDGDELKVWLYGMDLYAFSVTILSVLPELEKDMANFRIVKEKPHMKYTENFFNVLRDNFSQVELYKLVRKVLHPGTRDQIVIGHALNCITAAHDLGISQKYNELQTAQQKQISAINAIFTSCGYTTLPYAVNPVFNHTPQRVQSARATSQAKSIWR